MVSVPLLLALVSLVCSHGIEMRETNAKLGKYLVPGFRPPAVPLITMDIYQNIWSMSDNLTDTWPAYWPGTTRGLVGLIRIDNVTYRYMGPSEQAGGPLPPPMQQTSVSVFPTRTVYEFLQDGVQLTLTFISPLLPDNYDLLSRPITFLNFDVVSMDGFDHNVQLYYDNTAEVAVNTVDEQVTWQRASNEKVNVMQIGTTTQEIFGVTGDGVGIDWGYAYVGVAANDPSVSTVIYGSLAVRDMFSANGTIPSEDDSNYPRACNDNWPVMAVKWDLGSINQNFVSKMLMFGYDEIYALKFFGTPLLPYWSTNFNDVPTMMMYSLDEYTSIVSQCVAMDYQVLSMGYEVGGSHYSTMLALAYRQILAGCKLVISPDGTDTWYFMKEISSDGDISTVDVIFPSSPFFVTYAPDLLMRLQLPLLAYANNETANTYDYVFAPHHLGTWPVADILSNQQENMPIEETGNMIMMIVTSAIQLDDNSFLSKYEALLQQWAEYLITVLPDPGNQLCTDDFEGPTPHDANLAVKGIVALDVYARYLDFQQNFTGGKYFHEIAKKYSNDWMKLANPNKTNHYALRYDKPGWSLKYNLLYQVILGLNTFQQQVFDLELAFYQTVENTYGIPLDNRHDYTKLDWEYWIAALHNDDYFQDYINFLYNYANETPTRVPLSDWYHTTDGSQAGFQARTVVGGLYAKLATTALGK